MSHNTTLKITVPKQEDRLLWESISDTGFSDEEIFEIVQRYCDQADLQKKYHAKRNDRLKQDAAKAKALEAKLTEFAKASGLTLEQYLESEEKALAEPQEQVAQ